ncbi:TraR/DksA C4-type zinc finger protein [bacterium]|nr:TraR/DksA C4-type zinc finger protein [bacterium]
MGKKELEKYQELLIKEKERILEDIEGLEENNKSGSIQDRTGDISRMSTHPADRVADSMELEQSYSIATMEGEILYLIDEALSRIKVGSFGKCMVCGKKIAEKRLEAIPYTKLCLDCQRDAESEEV